VSFPHGRDPAVFKVTGLPDGPDVEVTAEDDGSAACHYTGRSAAQAATVIARLPAPGRSQAPGRSVVDHLAGCQEPPESFDLYKAGMRAIGRASDRELREHGITRGCDGLQVMPRFDARSSCPR